MVMTLREEFKKKGQKAKKEMEKGNLTSLKILISNRENTRRSRSRDT
jgi:hypothetical protein